MDPVTISETVKVGHGQPFLCIAGPCVLESQEMAFAVAASMKRVAGRLGINFIFKSSFDKANRTSIDSFRGPGIAKGLEIMAGLKREFDIPVLSDIHSPSQAREASEVLDVLQIPAFLCRQTDLLVAAAETGKVVNLKKGQFLSPWEMQEAIRKLSTAAHENRLLLTERGTFFGYNNLVVDMRSLPIMRSFGHPVIFDATHSVQLPGGAGGRSGGQREFIPVLARAAVAAGVDGVFMEVHPDPDKALCDGPNSLPLEHVESLLRELLAIHRIVKINQEAHCEI